MKKSDKKDRLQAPSTKKLSISKRELYQAKQDLIQAAAKAENNDLMPEHLWPDQTEDAWFRRKHAVSEKIKKRGGFSSSITTLALTDPDWETKETVAAWLRRELKTLRKIEATAGSAPVRRRLAMSRSEIADIAVELLECLGGQSLTCLFQELLDVDRRRKSLAEDFLNLDSAANSEAMLSLQGGNIGVREFAKLREVAPSTVTRWRRSEEYRALVQFHKDIWDGVLRNKYFDKIKLDSPNLTEAECFRRAFLLDTLSALERRQAEASGKIAGKNGRRVSPVLPKKPSLSRGKKSRKDSQ
jgi:hypothetical protein